MLNNTLNAYKLFKHILHNLYTIKKRNHGIKQKSQHINI